VEKTIAPLYIETLVLTEAPRIDPLYHFCIDWLLGSKYAGLAYYSSETMTPYLKAVMQVETEHKLKSQWWRKTAKDKAE
jgi:hypothetical protein